MPLNRSLKTAFNEVSAEYNTARPGYPPKVIDTILKYAKLPKNAKILEIGCGTGQATKFFAERGYRITAVDISANIVAIAQKNLARFKNVKFIVNSFEDAALTQNSFDIIIAAQSFHWIEPARGFAKINQLLKPGGVLALFWNLTEYNKTTWLAKIKKLFAAYSPHFTNNQRHRTTTDDLTTLGGLTHTKQYQFYWQEPYTKEKYLELSKTWSWAVALGKNKQSKLFAEVKKIIKNIPEPLMVPYQTDLLLGKK